MTKIGITGSIGAGKSTASKILKKHLNAYLFDADKELKTHLFSSISLQNKLINLFGQEIKGSDSKINSKLLASIAFKNQANQKLLNEVLWPEVFILIDEAINKAEKNNYKYFIVDAALLLESGLTDIFDMIVLITASENIRMKRAIERKKISLEQIKKRDLLQWSESKKSKNVDLIVKNESTLDAFHKRLIFTLNL
ncbi:MAG: dephospho-CoA kinase [Candidatus Marinimicrobia bacterium]|nr:dephospho-CoA kinase [Candidatus Neomarinimicrobiota bacterium]|tara:strand:+ start:1770 stop:2357 length:588 start_codon:yes stop_codon:yes gene_type:complete